MTRMHAPEDPSFLLDHIVARKVPALLARVRARSTFLSRVAYDPPPSTRSSGQAGSHDASWQAPSLRTFSSA